MNEISKRRAYEAGQAAQLAGQPISTNNGWGYPKGKYYYWYCLGWKGNRFESNNSEARFAAMRAAGAPTPDDLYAEAKARKLIAEAFRQAGQESHAKQYERGGFTTAPLRAFAAYISSRE